MRPRPQLPPTSSSDESNDGTDVESCFDTENQGEETDPDTNRAGYDIDVEGGDKVGGMIIDEDEDNVHPPECHFHQDELDESEYMTEDYSDGGCCVLDFIGEGLFQYLLRPVTGHR